MNIINNKNDINITLLYNKIANKIEIAKKNVAIHINNQMTILYWNIGKDIKENVLNYEKAEYGKSIIKELSQKLIEEYADTNEMFNAYKSKKEMLSETL